MMRLKCLLEYIVDVFFPPRATQLVVRSATLAQLRAYCRVQSVTLHDVEIHTLLPYRNPLVQACILEAKFHTNKKAQRLLGELLAIYLQEWERAEALVLVPLPLGKARLRERGYNQVERIAHYACTYLSKTVLLPSILARTRATAPQTSLGKEARELNMIGAFAAQTTQLPQNDTYLYIVVDDVVTTGATLLSAYTALQHANVERIRLVALAH